MAFDPQIRIGDKLTNDELRVLFQCGNMGGMRRSKATDTLVIISDETKGLYKDAWVNGVLHYTGMGKNGDQVLKGNQNRTLYESKSNGVEVHLFEVFERAVYTYQGVVKLVGEPYQTVQPDESGAMRKVWMFPLQPVAKLENPEEHELHDDDIAQLPDWRLIGLTEITNTEKIQKVAEVTTYYRNPYLKELVKRIASGKCQFCGKDAPFKDKHGKPYLEEHHVIQLADGGSDTIDNVVALCPNCHRMMHVLKKSDDIAYLTNIAKENKKQYLNFVDKVEQGRGVTY